MAEKDLDCRPHHIRGHNDDSWWYEDPKGIVVVVWGYDIHGKATPKQRLIPWRSIKNALGRRER
jgi:hypothetical protein